MGDQNQNKKEGQKYPLPLKTYHILLYPANINGQTKCPHIIHANLLQTMAPLSLFDQDNRVCHLLWGKEWMDRQYNGFYVIAKNRFGNTRQEDLALQVYN